MHARATFKAEEQRPVYGLTTPVGTFDIWDLQTHEYKAIARDWRSVASWRDKLGYAFGPPGWAPVKSETEPVSPSRG